MPEGTRAFLLARLFVTVKASTKEFFLDLRKQGSSR